MRSVNVFAILFALLVFSDVEASSTGISYHGRLLLPSGESVKANTQFRIQIRTPGNENCLMYEETTSRDLSLTDGVFSITIADGTGSRTDTLGLGLDAIFANRSKFVFTANCAIVTDYTPNAADGRRLQVSFNDGTFAGWEDLPVQNIGFAPISIESLQVGGFKASHLLRVADAGGIPQAVSALTPAYFAELVALAAGTSSVYAKAGSAVSGDNITTGTIGGATIIDTTGTIKAASVLATTGGFNTLDVWKADNSNKVSIKASNSQSANYILTLPVGTGTSGQVLSTDGTGILSWATPAPGGGSGTVTGVTSNNAYLTIANGTTAPALTLNVGAAANTVAAGDDARFSDARAPSGTAAGDLSGTYPNPGVAKIQGNAVATGTIPGADIGKVYRWNGTSLVSAFLTFGDLRTAAGAQQLAAACTANEKIQWSVITDAFTCQAIGSLNASAITAGTIDVARLPASAGYWQDGGSNKIYYSAANVGIGVAAPATKLDVNGAIRLGTEALTCDTSTSGSLRYAAASGGVEICNGSSWSLQTSGYPMPPSTTVLMDACPGGWTDIGVLPGGPGGANCNGVACHRCQSPATASLIPAGVSTLMDSCPTNWTNAGVALGSASAGYLINYQSCAPTASSLIPTGTRLAMDACPASWIDVGPMSSGPMAATCGGASCRACEVPGGAKPRALIGTSGVIGTDVVLAGGSATDGSGGRVLINAGNAGTTSAANNNGGDVIINSGSAVGSGTPGYLLLNNNASSAGYTGIGISVPMTTLHIYSAQPASVGAPNRAGLIVDGEGTSYGARIAARAFSPTEGAIFGGYRSLGDKTTMTAVTSGKGLVSLAGYGYDGSGWSSNSSSPGITMETSEIWSGTAKGSRITFGTTANTTTASTERMRIDHNGNVGIGTSTPATTLHVVGTFSAGASTTSSISSPVGMFGSMTVGLTAVSAFSPAAAVMSLQNTGNTGYGGAFLQDPGAVNRGIVGFSNSNTSIGESVVLASLDAATPVIFGVQGIEAARISSTDGFFGIGTNNPLTPLHVKTLAATAVASFTNSTGTCTVTPNTSSLSCSSDVRLKRNIENILGLTALNKIIQLQAKTYEWKGGDSSRHIGYIAQEAEKIVPELVTTDDAGYKQISYSAFVPLLSEAIKEVHQDAEQQKREVASINEEKEELKKQVETLNKKNEALEQKNKAFEARLIKLEKLLGN